MKTDFEMLPDIWQQNDEHFFAKVNRIKPMIVRRRAQLEHYRHMVADILYCLLGLLALGAFAYAFWAHDSVISRLGTLVSILSVSASLPILFAIRLRYRPMLVDRSLWECLHRERKRLDTALWLERLYDWIMLTASSGLGVLVGAARISFGQMIFYAGILMGFILFSYWRDLRRARIQLKLKMHQIKTSLDVFDEHEN